MKTRIIASAAIAAIVILAGLILWKGLRQRPEAQPKRYVTAPVVRQKTLSLPAIEKKYRRPKVAVVMDDFGYNVNNLDTLFDIRQPVTLSILPDLHYSAEIARLAGLRGHETILHLPLESHRKDVREEADTIRSGMSEEEIDARLAKALENVPGVRGVSNHMGSKSTEDPVLMTAIFKYLKKKRLYFFDSLTSEKSVASAAAKKTGLAYARRDIFLDNLDDTAYIEKQLLEMRALAFRRGRVIAVCHDRKRTITALSKLMPAIRRDGIDFVGLSAMVE